MSNQMGLWIDHRSAVIVSLKDDGEEVAHIDSNVEDRMRNSGESANGTRESQPKSADNRRQRMLSARLNNYYDTVIEAIQGAHSVLIFGPGEAKGELNTRLKDKHSNATIVGVETTDRLTDKEIAAKVRGYFAGHRVH
jgi:hypothetical protein